MAVVEAGLSSLGVQFCYGVSESGAAPSTVKQLERCNSIGGIALETEQIDASALEDYVSRYIAGRQDTGGTWEVVFNLTDEVITQLEAMIAEYKGLSGGQSLWFEVLHPNMAKAFWVQAQPPKFLPMPEMAQNELQTITMTFTIEEYKGMLTKVSPAA